MNHIPSGCGKSVAENDLRALAIDFSPDSRFSVPWWNREADRVPVQDQPFSRVALLMTTCLVGVWALDPSPPITVTMSMPSVTVPAIE